MSTETFNFNSFIKESFDSLLRPKEYFPAMKVSGGLGEPIIKALIYGVISGILGLIWGLLHLSVGGGLFGGAIGFMALIWSIIGALIGVFIGGVVVLIISAICGGSTDFEANIRVAASLMVLMPVNSLFNFLGGINFTLLSVVGAAINLYVLYMLYHALVGPLKGKEGSAKVITYVFGALVVLFLLIGFFTKKAANRFLDKFGTDTENFMEEFGKEMEKAGKDLNEALQEMEGSMDTEVDTSDVD